jgi:hypothetical protein
MFLMVQAFVAITYNVDIELMRECFLLDAKLRYSNLSLNASNINAFNGHLSAAMFLTMCEESRCLMSLNTFAKSAVCSTPHRDA